MSENERIENRRRTYVDRDQTHPANPGHGIHLHRKSTLSQFPRICDRAEKRSAQPSPGSITPIYI